MVNNLIVESTDDKVFIEALLRHYQNDDVAIELPMCHIDDFECMRGLNDRKLFDALSNLNNQMEKNAIQKAGIIIDNDGRVQERLDQINMAVQAVFDTTETLNSSGEFITITSNDVELQLGCFLMGVDDGGELETVLRAIAKAPSPYADCLTEWRECIRPFTKKEPFTPKEFEKLWLDAYMRWDSCSTKERKQAGRKCSKRGLDLILKKDMALWEYRGYTPYAG